ncbi:MAG: YdcH family protein [Myxococcales bacterium]|nr:YdcH family protein [Myxococcales bacterium]
MNNLSTNEKLELLRSISAEHQSLKARLRELEEQIFRTPADQVEIAELKKRKLLMKDKIRVLERN